MHMCVKCIRYDNAYVVCFIQNMLRGHSHSYDTQYTVIDCFSLYFITCHKTERLRISKLQILALCTKIKDELHLGKLKFYLIFSNLEIMLDIHESNFDSPDNFILMTSQ